MIRLFIYILTVFFVFWVGENTANAQKNYDAPTLTDSNSWSMILLPDPQNYHRFERNKSIFDLMMDWIDENTDRLHIKLVLCMGDLIINNDVDHPDSTLTNLTSRQQWEAVASSFGKLDGKIPYITALGNHDYGSTVIDNRRNSQFDHYFPLNKNRKTQKMVKETSLNVHGKPSMENSAFEFVSPQGRKFLILCLEFAPRDKTIAWANKVIKKAAYNDYTVILLTHSYLKSSGERILKENYDLRDANYGENLFQKLIKPSTNIQMVFCGHNTGLDFRSNVGFRVDSNAANKPVYQMMFNAQALGGGNRGNGGDGWLRILEFMPDKRTVKVKTFSPFFAISPSTQALAWRREPYDEFSFQLN
ncbi:Calcineurin-like phosphoesterase [bacterium A37T11]|nr:Calcineurin-like phosphoesterase [bacterium A37T11]